jgi:hypothetical protein
MNAAGSTPVRGHVVDGARELGDEMRAECWYSIGGEDRDYIFWMHEVSQRVVILKGPVPRRGGGYDCSSIPPLRTEPKDPTTTGYLVLCQRCDDLGNPVEGSGFWVEGFGEATKLARSVRTSILAEHPPLKPSEQQELFGQASPVRSEKGRGAE